MEGIIPKTESQITEAWIQQNTGLKPIDGTIKINGNIQHGIGFLSNLCRVSFEAEDGANKNILVKLLPQNEESRALVVDQGFDKIEIKFYSEVKPQLIEVAPELEENLCKDFGGRFTDNGNGSEYASMLILEDLKPDGYENLNPEVDDWEANLEKVLKFLAKLHAAGFALEEKRKMKISQLFPFCFGVDDSNLNLFLELVNTSAVKLREILKRPDCPDEIRASYEKISNYSSELMKKVFKKGEEHACLIHGDLWPPNVMMTKDGSAPIKIIDFQLLAYRDPTYELASVILTSVPKRAMNREIIEKYARFYFKEFSTTLGKKGLRNAMNRREAEFINFFNTWGICYAYIWFLGSIDAFPNDPERLYETFVLLQEKYDVVGMLSQLL